MPLNHWPPFPVAEMKKNGHINRKNASRTVGGTAEGRDGIGALRKVLVLNTIAPATAVVELYQLQSMNSIAPAHAAGDTLKILNPVLHYRD
jgi:hypothetical protein